MNNNWMLIPSITMDKVAIKEITNCNNISSRFGLILSQEDAKQLVITRADALRKNGRIEFAGGVIRKIIIEFCDSPYITQTNYATTLYDLIEIFYYFKNETHDEITDDELITLMKNNFDQNCRGSIELLQGLKLELLARGIRFENLDEDDENELS